MDWRTIWNKVLADLIRGLIVFTFGWIGYLNLNEKIQEVVCSVIISKEVCTKSSYQ